MKTTSRGWVCYRSVSALSVSEQICDWEAGKKVVRLGGFPGRQRRPLWFYLSGSPVVMQIRYQRPIPRFGFSLVNTLLNSEQERGSIRFPGKIREHRVGGEVIDDGRVDNY